jgi:hypothetical protein
VPSSALAHLSRAEESPGQAGSRWRASISALPRKRWAPSILLDTMFDLPSLEGVEEVVISTQVVKGTAWPLHIYADRSDRAGAASA